MFFGKSEQKRYLRHFVLPHFGEAGQQKLFKAKVLMVGAGGLGCAALPYLAAAGIGHIGIADFDVVDETNLQRQILFTPESVGKNKAQEAEKWLKKQNPSIKFSTFTEKISHNNAEEIFNRFHVIVDGTDNYLTKFLINDVCHKLNKPWVFAAVHQHEGQLSVFQLNSTKHGMVNYRDLYPVEPTATLATSCAEAGVMGALPGIIGTMQAYETIKICAQFGEPLAGKLFVFDALTFSSRTLNIPKNHNNPLINNNFNDVLQDAQIESCSFENANQTPTISAKQFKDMMRDKEVFHLVDVRTPTEFEAFNIGGENIPLELILLNKASINHQNKTIFVCQSGKRSQQAVQFILKNQHLSDVYNLEDGLLGLKNQ